jgi:hypothetical protein
MMFLLQLEGDESGLDRSDWQAQGETLRIAGQQFQTFDFGGVNGVR